jgi:hypothetical protein
MSYQGFKLVESTLFEEFYSDWAKNSNYLNNTSKLFSFLNTVMVFEKNSEYSPAPKKILRKQKEPIDFCEFEKYSQKDLQIKKISELISIAQPLGFSMKKYKKADIVDYILQTQ